VILPFDTVHDCAEPMGFLLVNYVGEKLLFLTDTSFCRYKFKGLTHMMIECNFSNELLEKNIASGVVEASRKRRLIGSHFSLDRVKTFLRANDLRKLQSIWLIHLSGQNSDAFKFKQEIQQLTGKPVVVC
jgi:phosphoribosyl 1,2-cyclic phosphodiesterase